MLFCYIHITISLKRSALRVVPVPAPIITPGAESGDSRPSKPILINGQQDSLLRARRNIFKNTGHRVCRLSDLLESKSGDFLHVQPWLAWT